MTVTSHTVHLTTAGVRPARILNLAEWLVVLAALIFSGVPSAAQADIYKWNDAQGRIVVSNIPPVTTADVKDLDLLVKETRTADSPERGATHTEQALLSRIEMLERQLQAQSNAYPPAPAPPSMGYGNYYPPAATMPPPTSYSSAYDPNYYPNYYPSYYYPVAPYYSYVVFPTRRVISRPAFGFSHGSAFRGGGGHVGGGRVGVVRAGGGHRGR